MFPASRWAARLSRQTRLLQPRRYISTKERGIARKIPRVGLPHNNPSQTRHGNQDLQNGGQQAETSSGSPEEYQTKTHALEEAKKRRLPDAQYDQGNAVQNALQRSAESDQNDMLAPVHIPEDPLSILKSDHPATSILANSTIIIQRQIEMMNIMVGFEQANKYVILDALGNHIGYLAEPEGNMLKRQLFKTHRGFTAHVFDRHEKEVLRITRPFTFINSRVGVYDAVNTKPGMGSASSDALSGLSAGSIANGASAQLSSLRTEDMRVIGEVQQQWAPLRRKYNLFLNRPTDEQTEANAPQLTAGDLPLSNSTALQTIDPAHRTVHMSQWAYTDEPFLSWDFSLLTSNRQLLGSVNRNFSGFAREIFTDTGVYALRMDSAALASEPRHLISRTGESALQEAREVTPGMTLDQRAVMLATAVSIDFDYFSRKSGSGGILPMPMWIPWWGGGAAEAGAGAGAAEAGAAAVGVGGLGTEVGAAARGAGGAIGAGEGAMAGAGSVAGYEAMQRGFGRGEDGASPTAQDPFGAQQPPPTSQQGEEPFWGENSPWDQGEQSPWDQGEQSPWKQGQDEQSPWGQNQGDQSSWSGGGGDGGGGSGGGGGGDGGGIDWGDWF